MCHVVARRQPYTHIYTKQMQLQVRSGLQHLAQRHFKHADRKHLESDL